MCNDRLNGIMIRIRICNIYLQKNEIYNKTNNKKKYILFIEICIL